jgi:hypothetical protein
MSWRYCYPVRSDFDSLEEYEHACELYEQAEDDYAEAYREEQLESRFC